MSNFKFTVLVVACLVAGCGIVKAAGSIRIAIYDAPDGTRCYVVTQDGEARGLSCR